MAKQTPSTQTYAGLLASIKERIQTAQVRASVAVNRELVLLYWGIGKEILARQLAEGWGTKVIERLWGWKSCLLFPCEAARLDQPFPPLSLRSRDVMLGKRMHQPAWGSVIKQDAHREELAVGTGYP